MNPETSAKRVEPLPIDRPSWIRSLLEEQESPLLHYALHLTHDLDLAQDAVQDTFLRLCKEQPEKIDAYKVEWMFTVCRSRAYDLLKKRARTSFLSDEILNHHFVEEPLPGERMASDEVGAEVMQLVSELPERQQELLRLKYQAGLSYKEIAKITKLSTGNVGFLLSTALQTLRNAWRARETRETMGLLPQLSK